MVKPHKCVTNVYGLSTAIPPLLCNFTTTQPPASNPHTPVKFNQTAPNKRSNRGFSHFTMGSPPSIFSTSCQINGFPIFYRFFCGIPRHPVSQKLTICEFCGISEFPLGLAVWSDSAKHVSLFFTGFLKWTFSTFSILSLGKLSLDTPMPKIVCAQQCTTMLCCVGVLVPYIHDVCAVLAQYRSNTGKRASCGGSSARKSRSTHTALFSARSHYETHSRLLKALGTCLRDSFTHSHWLCRFVDSFFVQSLDYRVFFFFLLFRHRSHR